jgi:hypothetical protein
MAVLAMASSKLLLYKNVVELRLSLEMSCRSMLHAQHSCSADTDQ